MKLGSIKNIHSPGLGVNLENSRIIEEDYHENDCDSVMPRLEENKSSLEELCDSEDDFFDEKEEEKSGTPRFIPENDTELTMTKLNENNVSQE